MQVLPFDSYRFPKLVKTISEIHQRKLLSSQQILMRHKN